MDIARRVGGHIAFGTEEGRVDSCLSGGCRLPSHWGGHDDHKKAEEARRLLKRKTTGWGWCDTQMEVPAALHSPHLLPCEMEGIENDPGRASS